MCVEEMVTRYIMIMLHEFRLRQLILACGKHNSQYVRVSILDRSPRVSAGSAVVIGV
jgi:hypothetical protein